ncbi:MAG: AAA family ATPase, partial [Polyangiales bacterium]
MIWSFGEFEVDADRYELRRQGDVVELRPKVLDVLLYLVRHNDRLVSKDELLRNLWPGETIHEGVLPQNIALLRKLVGDTRDQANVIQTVHGRGYRFVAKVMGSGSVRPPPRDDSRVSSAQLPFVGRDRVLETLRTALDDAFAGRGRFAVVIGEAGIGKTRTLEAIAQEAAAAGARVLEARCHESHGAPAYFPWVQMLRAAQDHIASSQGVPGATEAGHLLGELSRDFG